MWVGLCVTCVVRGFCTLVLFISEALVVYLCCLSRSCLCKVCTIVNAVCHVHACATSAQLFQRLLLFLYAVYHFFAELKFGRMFQLPLYSDYVACLALFSQISLVQSLKFFDVSSLPFWQYTALSFFTER